MSFYLPRTVRERRSTDPEGQWSHPTPLADHADTHAWVLMADPGAGKTDAFKALEQAEGGTCISAREFIELGPPEGYSSPLFIDSLDEYTTAQGNAGHSALGQIRAKLQELGTPKFRIACREADWRGSTDSDALQRLVTRGNTANGTFSELHLEPLTETQIIAFIRHHMPWDEAQARQFIRSAQDKELEGLLDNPQTLLMLLKSVTPDQPELPTSKLETYQRACAALVREHNQAHADASSHVLLTDADVLHAAAYLCAVMLLSGSAVLAKVHSHQHPAHVLVLRTLPLNPPDAPSLEACQTAIGTKLFAGTGSGRFVPRHRTVAEYLAATYVARRLQTGLPLPRVLALMQGEDGGVVPALRGLHAWLAVAAGAQVRENLIDRDPLGLVLHGDVRGFTVTEKIRLLDGLKREATRYTHFRNLAWNSKPFGALATPDMQAHFQGLLRSPDRSPTHQAVLDCVLDAMHHGHPMPDLAPELEQVVRDKTLWPRIRQTALDTLCGYDDHGSHTGLLRQLLNDIGANRIEDHGTGMCELLLQHLYPMHIQPSEIWQWYLPLRHRNANWDFWHRLLKLQTKKPEVPQLLNSLLTSNLRIRTLLDDPLLPIIIGELLYCALTDYEDNTDIPCLYAWMGLGLDEYNDSGLESNAQDEIAAWLSAHPLHYKALMEYGITQLEHSNTLVHLWLYELQNRLCKADPPTDAPQWLLSLANDRNDDFRYQLIKASFDLTKLRKGTDAALNLLATWLLSHPADADWIQCNLLSHPYPPERDKQEHIERNIQRKTRVRQQKEEKLLFLRDHLPGLTGPQPHLGLLNHLGETYFGDFNGGTPQARLLQALNDDPHWVSFALAGLEQCLERTDLPSADSVITGHLKSSRYHVALPCLAAMDLRYAEHGAAAFDGLPPSCIETLVAFRLTNDYGDAPAWFLHLVATQPNLVGAVMQRFLLRQIAVKKEHVSGAYALTHDALYAPIAQRITPTLIRALPTKAPKKQLKAVRQLIACLLNQLPAESQLTLIDEKLALAGMDVAQRTYWFTAGLLVCPERYFEPLKAFLGGSQTRASHAFDLLHDRGSRQAKIGNLTAEARGLFVELLGARFTPFSHPEANGEGYVVTPAIETAEFARHLIASLAADTTEAATQALSHLEQHAALKPWRERIRQAAYEQQIARRKALFQPASVDAVCKTLANRQPANAADLWALTVAHLTALADNIRNSSTNDSKQYWDKDQKTPKIENDCRDALLSDLKVHLQLSDVNAEREGSYADDKRADIKVLFGPWHIPVEVKRESHPDVWTAITNQLIAKYSREAASDGYGVYIVFWFQGKLAGTPIDGGRKPRTPQELQQRLMATVPPELQSKIAVLVVDCSHKK
jgi:hypothetical protein